MKRRGLTEIQDKRLEDWKQKKKKNKEEERKNKKPPFVVGIAKPSIPFSSLPGKVIFTGSQSKEIVNEKIEETKVLSVIEEEALDVAK